MMPTLFIALFLSLPVFAAADEGTPVPVHIQYLKMGTESPERAEAKGKLEIESGNPCVLKMKQEAEIWSTGQGMQDATRTVQKDFFGDPKPRPHLVIQYRHDSMELHYELRSLPERGPDGYVYRPEKVVYRKGVIISSKTADWKERLSSGKCKLTEKNFAVLLDEVNEADRLATCMKRKVELIESSRKVSNYLHTYVPKEWLDGAVESLKQQNVSVNGVLRENPAVYRQGNDKYRNCARGLKLLEREAADSVAVLSELRATKKGVTIPQEVEVLQAKLNKTSDGSRMLASPMAPVPSK